MKRLTSHCCKAPAKINMAPEPMDPIHFCTKCGVPCRVENELTGFNAPSKGITTARKVTGERALFLNIYAEVNGRSEVSGFQLLPPSHPQFHWQFSHILPKGAYGKARLVRENIVACTVAEHEYWENHKDKQRLADEDHLWKPYALRYFRLRLKYNTDNQTPTS